MLRITKTENGIVKGFPGTDARITVFKGIPYAADTSGENRWRPPQPAQNWEGVRECYDFGPITMQKTPGINPDAFYSKEWHVDPEVPMSEDSLRVNIWTNAKTGKEKMPVMVWIFGGGLQEGYAHEMEFDGERIAARDVVLVSIAYRLNAFGFLAHPDLTAENPEAPANFGFLDQKAAIEWVKRNIENFGGDPENITILGQSAGGISVFCHLCSPQTEGLFQKAVIQSSAGGAVISQYPKVRFNSFQTLEEAEAIGAKFLKEKLGVDTIAEARKLDATFIRDKVVENQLWFPQIADGKFLSKDIADYLLADGFHRVPVMMGYTGDEGHTPAQGETLEEIKAWAAENYGDKAEEALAVWSEGAADLAAIRANSDVNFNEMSTRLVGDIMAQQGRDLYCYAFNPTIPGDNAGSFHSSDLWFTFETLMRCWRPFDGYHYDLARKMCNYWTNFAKYGNPNGNDADGTAMPKWEAYTTERANVIQFFDEISMEEGEPNAAMRKAVELNRAFYLG